MKTLTFEDHNSDDYYYKHDIRRIVDVCAANGYQISPSDAKLAWEAFSESMSAGWMGLDDDDDSLFCTVRFYCLESEND